MWQETDAVLRFKAAPTDHVRRVLVGVHRLLRETLKGLQEARHLCSDGQHLGLRRRDRGGGAAMFNYCYETTSRIMAPAGSATLCTI